MQVISKDGKVKCETKVDYPPDIVKIMKQAGYKVKAVEK